MVNFGDKIVDDSVAAPASPCRARSGPTGIVSTNPCTDVQPNVAPASTRIPDHTRSRYCSLSQAAAPATLDLGLCATAPEPCQRSTATRDAIAGSPCQGRTSSILGTLNIVSATPCNTPTASLSAPQLFACNGGFSTPPCNRLADASARTPAPPPVRATPLSTGLATSAPMTTRSTPDAFTLGIEQGPFSPCCPRVLFPGAAHASAEDSELAASVRAANSGDLGAGVVVADAMRSWLQSSGLAAGSPALEAELRAAVPEAYED